MPERTKAVVKIAGVDYTIVSDESLEYIQRIGIYVDQKLKEVLSHNKRLSTAMASLLASINIGDDYQKSQDQAERLKMELQKCSSELHRTKTECETAKHSVEQLKQEVQKLQIELANKNGRLSK